MIHIEPLIVYSLVVICIALAVIRTEILVWRSKRPKYREITSWDIIRMMVRRERRS